MKFRLIAFTLALTLASWAQNSNQTAPVNPASPEKAACSCCDKGTPAGAEAGNSCCSHMTASQDAKEPGCCSGKHKSSCCEAKSCARKQGEKLSACNGEKCGRACKECTKACGKSCKKADKTA